MSIKDFFPKHRGEINNIRLFVFIQNADNVESKVYKSRLRNAVKVLCILGSCYAIALPIML